MQLPSNMRCPGDIPNHLRMCQHGHCGPFPLRFFVAEDLCICSKHRCNQHENPLSDLGSSIFSTSYQQHRLVEPRRAPSETKGAVALLTSARYFKIFLKIGAISPHLTMAIIRFGMYLPYMSNQSDPSHQVLRKCGLCHRQSKQP